MPPDIGQLNNIVYQMKSARDPDLPLNAVNVIFTIRTICVVCKEQGQDQSEYPIKLHNFLYEMVVKHVNC